MTLGVAGFADERVVRVAALEYGFTAGGVSRRTGHELTVEQNVEQNIDGGL